MRIDELGPHWRKAYKHMADSYQTKYAAAIARYYRPKKLYKFFPFDPQYWRRNIFHGDLVFNYPSSYNDPMDSRWFLDYEKIVKERYKDAGEEWNDEEIKNLMKCAIPLYEEDLSYLRYLFQISCFSESPCSNLMWGHYGGKHRGFCLEYDVERLALEFPLMLPVIYTQEPFQAWQLIDKRGIDEDLLVEITPYLYKSRDWSYEQEWRVFIPPREKDKDTTIISVQNCITGIFFGLRSFPEERREIEEWAKGHEVTVYQMERIYGSYDFVYDRVDDLRQGKKKGLLL